MACFKALTKNFPQNTKKSQEISVKIPGLLTDIWTRGGRLWSLSWNHLTATVHVSWFIWRRFIDCVIYVTSNGKTNLCKELGTVCKLSVVVCSRGYFKMTGGTKEVNKTGDSEKQVSGQRFELGTSWIESKIVNRCTATFGSVPNKPVQSPITIVTSAICYH